VIMVGILCFPDKDSRSMCGLRGHPVGEEVKVPRRR
jgi:hypothetical protein